MTNGESMIAPCPFCAGVRTEVVEIDVGNPAPKATIDNVMVKALARAFRWQALLENGTYGCIEDIARGEKIGASFVSRIVKMALLAPDIVDAILEGKQPALVTLGELMKALPQIGPLLGKHAFISLSIDDLFRRRVSTKKPRSAPGCRKELAFLMAFCPIRGTTYSSNPKPNYSTSPSCVSAIPSGSPT